MSENENEKPQKGEAKPRQLQLPLVFISHDSRDAGLAEAFSKLLHSATSGMLKSFRSSDKKGTEGIEFGDEWYKRLMSKLGSASDVVCLLTERSIERPWILYEAGVAKGKLDTPVLGIALGIPLRSVGTGPFFQFQNSDDSEESLTKLVMQLTRRIPDLQPDPDVVESQVQTFKSRAEKILAELEQPGVEGEETAPEASMARVLEELKFVVRELPSSVAERIKHVAKPDSRGRFRRFSPGVFNQIWNILPKGSEDPLLILLVCSLFKDEFPWLYELGREAYGALQSRSAQRRKHAYTALRRAIEITLHSGVAEEIFVSRNDYSLFRDAMGTLINVMEKMRPILRGE